ncbi:MAG: PilZ domain-containing protein [Hyphomicrobiales bacterium]|nr:PilZ domain-containing protein [Hyphomicrobiales bacterium]MDE2017069.1 PilZ domain-containing protein [Hyphomicrobiales bacterium]
MVERRRSPRKRVIYSAKATYAGRQALIDGVVRNLSEGGARFDADQAIAVPDSFELEMPHEGATRRARVTWRHDHSIGLAFDAPGKR